MKMLLVLQLICLVFLGGGQAETLGADVEGSSYAEVEEILLEAQVEQLTKENLNLIEKIQIQDKQLENMRTLEAINKNLQQENIANMEKNQNLRAENTFQANEIVQLKEKLQSKETMLQNNLTKTIQDLHNATVQARKFESLLQAELQSKSTHKEDAHLERQRHEITKQELEDLKILVKMSMKLTRIQNRRSVILYNITASMDMDQTIRKMKEKEILYLADIQAYQNEILKLRNATNEENDQKERLKIAITQQSQLGESNERMLRFLTSVIVNMTTSIHNCSTITTDAQQVQLDALQEKEDTMKQLITQCSMFNASSIALQNHYIQVNSQLKDQLGIKNNVIRHHIEENKERSNDLEETKQLTEIQSEALEIMSEELERFIPEDLNRRTIVRRSADGTIKSASLCQCIPETPDESELELTSIHWSCPLDKAIIKNGSQIENTISLPCSVSGCSIEESIWPQCEDVLEKSWTPWEYYSCTEIGVGNETILCGSGHRSRSREVRSSSANPWKNETATEQCQHCSLSFDSILGGQKMTITPPALRNVLNNSMDISSPIHTVVLEKSWTPWEYLSCTEIGVGNEIILCGSGHRSRSREVRSSSANSWRNETVTDQCQHCSLSFASILGGQKMTITPPELRNALNNSIDISNPIRTVVLKKSWTPWEYLSCTEIGVGNETILCGTGNRSRSREVRSSSANPWRTEDVTENCQHCSLSFTSILEGQKMTITPTVLESALNNSMDISNPIPTIPSTCAGLTLVGGSIPNEGNVYYNGKPVCDDGWNSTDATVVCRELGYSGFLRFYRESHYGPVPEVFSMDDVHCTGTESRLQDCPHLTSDNCNAAEGAGVVCNPIRTAVPVKSCTVILEKSWTPWEYLSCTEIGVGNETILCGSGHRSRSREVRSSSANPWRNESVTEQCQNCNLSFSSILGGQKMTITPSVLENALNSSMEISNPIPSIPCPGSFPANKCFEVDTNITFHDIGINHMSQSDLPVWNITQGGNTLIQMQNTRPSVGVSDIGDPSKPVSYTGRIFSNNSDTDVIGVVFGFQDKKNFFVVASSKDSPGPTNWYVGRLHATCGASCHANTIISDAIWNPPEHPTDITVLKSGTDFWSSRTIYKFSICFDPSKLLMAITIVNETNGNAKVLETGPISGITGVSNVDIMSRAGGSIGVYVDSQQDTTWEGLQCGTCSLS